MLPSKSETIRGWTCLVGSTNAVVRAVPERSPSSRSRWLSRPGVRWSQGFGQGKVNPRGSASMPQRGWRLHSRGVWGARLVRFRWWVPLAITVASTWSRLMITIRASRKPSRGTSSPAVRVFGSMSGGGGTCGSSTIDGRIRSAGLGDDSCGTRDGVC